MSEFIKYLGAPYKSGGRTIDEGLDCYGLFLLVMKEVYGKDIPDVVYNKPNVTEQGRLIKEYKGKFAPIRLDKPKVGAAAILNKGTHIGVYISETDNLIIHCTSETGVIIQSAADFGEAEYYDFN